MLFLAAHIKLFGLTGMWAARLTQALLGVLLVWQVMRLARRLAPSGGERRVSLIAGWAMALSYSFASFAFFLLGETFFLVLFVAALLALLRWRDGEGLRWLVVAGVLFGLSALTKALVLTFMPIVAIWVGVSESQVSSFKFPCAPAYPVTPSPRHLAAPLSRCSCSTFSVCAVVLPWTAYATLRWGGGQRHHSCRYHRRL